MKYLKPIFAILSLLFKMIPLQVRIKMAILILRELAKLSQTDIDDKWVDEFELKTKEWTKKQ